MPRHILCPPRRAVWLLALLVLMTTACQEQQAQDPTPAPTLAPTAPPLKETPPDAVVQMAIDALGGVLGVDASAVALVTIERQDFGDAALGCAQPGEMAASVITPGYQVMLSVGGVQYELHVNVDGTMVRCLPSKVAQPSSSPLPLTPTPEKEVDKTPFETALENKDYDELRAAMSTRFWLGFYGAEADVKTPKEAMSKLQDLYLGPGLVRVFPDVNVEKLLPDWASAAPYARFVYSTGWGKGQRDDAILLFEEQADALHWAGLFYVFDSLKEAAYGAGMAELPSPPVKNLQGITDAIEGKAYQTIESLLTDPVFLGFYGSEASDLSPHTFVEALQRNYLEPGEVKVRFDVDATRLLTDDLDMLSSCDELLYSTGWGEGQADDGMLCFKNEAGALRWSGLLYVMSSLKETAYAQEPPSAEEPAKVDDMVHIPPGEFIMGSGASDVAQAQADCLAAGPGCNTGQFEDETPLRVVMLDGFYIDKTEVTVADFKAFAAATGYQTTSEAKGDAVQYTWRAFDTPDRQNHPARWMSWHDAQSYCHWAGKRMPTEAEWEKAARGAEGLVYPWGQVWDAARAPHGDTAPADAFANGASPYGVLGMAGGVWEWVADWYDPFYYQQGPATNPTGPQDARDKVLRGGAFSNEPWKMRTTFRHFGGATGYSHDHGFRCARDE